MQWTWAGENGVRVVLAESPSPAASARQRELINALSSRLGSSLTDAVPAYTALTLFFDPTRIDRSTLLTTITEAIESLPRDSTCATRVVTLPVWYGEEAGADLADVAAYSGLSIAEVIALHSGTTYTAYANGFAPGFCYLGGLPAELARPRLSTPRRSVPAGSVAIADRQTAVYPRQSPGGWHLLGRCPTLLFDVNAEPPNRLQVGDQVRFEAIDKARYLELGGVL